MDENKILTILNIFESSTLCYFKYSMDGNEIIFSKESDNTFAINSFNMGNPKQPVTVKGTHEENEKPSVRMQEKEEMKAENVDADNNRVSVKANFVGMFTLSDNLKKANANVKKGDVLGNIEAMKIYNDIISPVDGDIEQILVKDGSLVECEQELMIIRVNSI